MLKRNAYTLCGPLTQMINRSTTGMILPDCMKKAVVIPPYKGGDTAELGNFGPILILPVISEEIDKIIAI